MKLSVLAISFVESKFPDAKLLVEFRCGVLELLGAFGFGKRQGQFDDAVTDSLVEDFSNATVRRLVGSQVIPQFTAVCETV